MTNSFPDISEWFSKRPKWLQLAAKHLMEQGELADEYIDKFAEICLKEARGEDLGDTTLPPNLIGQKTDRKIRLHSFGNVEGVDALAPGQELEFDGKDLIIVYGMNGAGKSGYIRILKQICQARGAEKLRGNVFKDETRIQTAIVKFKEEGNEEEPIKEKWDGQKVIDELTDIEIFDTLSGKIFVDEKGETCYEPPELSWLTELADFCTKIKIRLGNWQLQYPIIPIKKPQDIEATNSGNWFSKLSHATTNEEINVNCSFTEEHEQRIATLQEILKFESSADRLEKLGAKKIHLGNIIQKADGYLTNLSDEKCNEIIKNKISIEQQEVIIKDIANKKFGESYLNGTGSQMWKGMWNAAKLFFEKEAYLGHGYNSMSEAESCVLCQQPITPEAKSKFEEFETFMSQKAEENLRTMKKGYADKLSNIKGIESKENLENILKLAGLEKSHPIINLFDELRSRHEKLPELNSIESLKPIANQKTLENIKDILKQYESDIEECRKNDDTTIRENATKEQSELLAKKWLAENKQTIIDKVTAEKKRNLHMQAISSTNTGRLTSKKNKLSSELMTPLFIKRFNEELLKLGADHLQVKLSYDEGKIGHVYYKVELHKNGIELKGLELGSILSEGENRIVSLAAFLADVTGKQSQNPFFFDDPISSLDEIYEEKVVERLLELSKERQVIIFTHRLSFIGNVEHLRDKGESKRHRIINIVHFNNYTGVPSPMLDPNKNIEKFINELLNNKYGEIKKLVDAFDTEKTYDEILKICINFRIALERSIEEDLFCGIIKRSCIRVKSGMLKDIKKITKDEAEIIDGLMTKYSKYVHSHSGHPPYQLPEFEELFNDIKEFKKWRDDFRAKKN